MANVKITQLDAIGGSGLADTDVFVLVDLDADTTKKINKSELVIGISDANDFVTYTLLNANVNVVSDNVTAAETRLNANLDVVQDNVAALPDSAANDFVTYTRLNANINVVSDNVTAAETRLNANIDVVQDNVAALPDSAANDFVTYTRLNANINVVSDNVATNATDITALETRRTNNIAGAVSTITTENLTASRALTSDGSGKVAVSDITSTELGYLDGVTSAIQTQLNAKIATTDSASNDFVTYTRLNANVDVVQDNVATITARSDAYGTYANTQLGLKAPLASPTFTGVPAAPTAAAGTSTTQLATTAFVGTAVANLVDGSPEALNTLNELAAALGDDANFSTTVLNQIGTVSSNTVTNATNITALETRRTNNIAGAISSVTTSDLTASRALASDGSGKIAVSAVTSTELGYLDGVTSGIQTQLDAKIASAFSTITGTEHTTGTYNSYAIGVTVTNVNNVFVSLNGITQRPSEYVLGASGANVQFKDASLASGLELELRTIS